VSAATFNGFDNEAAQIATALHGIRSGNGWVACCPAHEDHKPSLSINQDGDRVLLKCHANCTQKAVIDALREQGLWEPRPVRIDAIPRKTFYVYNDEQGKPLHRTERKPNKKFIQWSYQNGQWIPKLGPRTVLYHLDELTARSSETLYVAEGEEDVDKIRSLGYLCTCNPMGAGKGKWLEDYTESIRRRESREVVIFYDNDPPSKKFPGQDHAQTVALSLLEVGCRVRIVDLPEGKDVRDYLALGHTKAELDALIASAPYQTRRSIKAWRKGFEDQLAEVSTGLPVPKSQQDLPWINVASRQLRDKTAECLDALRTANNPPELFVRSGSMVRITKDEEGRQGISPIDEDRLRNHLTQAANFRRPDPRKVGAWIQTSPPADTVSAILALPPVGWGFPALKAVIEAPALRRDGTILDTPGYDPATKLYYAPSSGLSVHVPESPTAEDLRLAVAWIDELIGEFPFVDRASRANKIAGMLTPVCRPAIDGSTPLQLLDATAPASGKTLLSEVDSIVTTGRPGSLFSAPKEKAEWDKQLTTVLWRGSPVVVMDNVSGRLESEDLCRALTGQTYAARIMKTQEQIDLPVYCSWVATGNNIQVDSDMARRCYRVRLAAKCTNPAQRSNFKHPELKTWAFENRSQILGALLTMARAWFVAGKPAPKIQPVGSFESWSFVIGGILQHAKIEGFLENTEEFLAQANPEARQWENFLLTLHDVFYELPFLVSDVEKKLLEKTYNSDTHTTEPTRNAARLRDSLPDWVSEVIDKPGHLKQRLGRAFSQRRGTWYGEYGTYLEGAGDVHRAQLWKICTSKKGEAFPG
jgi:hypothetical protein